MKPSQHLHRYAYINGQAVEGGQVDIAQCSNDGSRKCETEKLLSALFGYAITPRMSTEKLVFHFQSEGKG